MPTPHSIRDNPAIRALTPRRAALEFLDRLRGGPLFACVVASTDTAEIPGISAAGETPEKRRYTAALDAEFLVHGQPLPLPELPKNPLGPPSPVVVTRAALALLGAEALTVDAGPRIPPRVPRLVLGGTPGQCITTGRAPALAPEVLENAAIRVSGRLDAAEDLLASR